MSLMLIDKTDATAPACFGVCCPQHASCARYAAADGPAGQHAVATCDDDNTGARPLFLAHPPADSKASA